MNVTFEKVFASWHRNSILENISFTAESGTVTALTGRNGAGKSTLIQCLTGQKRDYRGIIRLDGQDIRSLDRRQLAQTLACLPQDLPRPHVTVRELVGFGRSPYTPLSGRLSDEDRDRVEWALDAVGIGRFAETQVDTLSGGERKKAFFAMTLAQDTPVVVLDEPTAHLDTVSRFEYLELIAALGKSTGKTFLVVMHDLPEVLRYAHRIVTLHEKSLVFDGTPAQCLAAGIPERCFRIRVQGSPEVGFAVTSLK